MKVKSILALNLKPDDQNLQTNLAINVYRRLALKAGQIVFSNTEAPSRVGWKVHMMSHLMLMTFDQFNPSTETPMEEIEYKGDYIENWTSFGLILWEYLDQSTLIISKKIKQIKQNQCNICNQCSRAY